MSGEDFVYAGKINEDFVGYNTLCELNFGLANTCDFRLGPALNCEGRVVVDNNGRFQLGIYTLKRPKSLGRAMEKLESLLLKFDY